MNSLSSRRFQLWLAGDRSRFLYVYDKGSISIGRMKFACREFANFSFGLLHPFFSYSNVFFFSMWFHWICIELIKQQHLWSNLLALHPYVYWIELIYFFMWKNEDKNQFRIVLEDFILNVTWHDFGEIKLNDTK